MITSGTFDRLVGMLPPEYRLLHRAKSGDVGAFVKLCAPHIGRIYQYVHFLTPNNRAAEGLTYRVFFKAWERIGSFKLPGASFDMWLFGIAREHINERARKTGEQPDNAIALASRGGMYREEYQLIRDALDLLAPEQRHFLVLKFITGMDERNIARLMRIQGADMRELQLNALQALAHGLGNLDSPIAPVGLKASLEDSLKRMQTRASILDERLVRHLKHAAALEPLLETALLLTMGRGVQPLPAFEAYTHDALLQYLKPRPRPRKPQTYAPALRRMAMTFAVVAAALLITGTVQAQAAMPGEPLYGLKRASENVWQALSSDPAAADIYLAERRLDEWIAVSNDPALRRAAMDDYQAAIAQLKDAYDGRENRARVEEMLEAHQLALAEAGLTSPELDHLAALFLPPSAQPQTTPAAIHANPPSNLSVPFGAVIRGCAAEPDCEQGLGNNNAGGNNAGGNSGNTPGNNAGGNKGNNAGGNNGNNGNHGNNDGKGKGHDGDGEGNGDGNGKGGGKDK